jgi:hypothetical protein
LLEKSIYVQKFPLHIAVKSLESKFYFLAL